MSHGETGSGKSKVKQAWEAHALLEKYGLTLEQVDKMLRASARATEHNERANALLADPDWSPPEEVAEVPIKTVEPVTVRDCLGWITPDTQAVYLVSKNSTLSLRPSKPNLNPPMDQVWINTYARGTWDVMPFSLKSRASDPDARFREEHKNKVMYSEWGKFCVTRDIAEQCFEERYPLPTKAVISPDEFDGWSRHTQRALGTYRDLENPDALREVVRRVLQRVSNTFINVRFHREYGPPDWDPRIANPYRNSLGSLQLARGLPLETV